MPFADFDGVNGHNHYQPVKRPADNEFYHTTVRHVQQSSYSFEALQESAEYLLDRIKIRPKIGIICGSGMGSNEQNELCPGSLAESLEDQLCFPYAEIPHFPVSTVKGHTGQMVFGYLKGVPVMCMQGRFHYYEGYPLWKCSMPVRVMKLVGVTHLIATNAAGGLNPRYKVGDIMMVKDHVNMMGFAGNNPLQGPNDDRFGPRFPPMNKAYSIRLLEIGQEVAEEMGISDIVHKGVYTCLGGPNFETVAELKMLRMVGVDAVGMSTVHEVITARHCDLTVFAFSLITNQCVTDYDNHDEANHEEVMDVGKARQPMLQEYVSRMVLRLHGGYATIKDETIPVNCTSTERS
ncbi:purine nucleoside phosphorylase-like isoform X1 [Osmia bicornis bicornis]|uniref:purine nucleoside phosphorylase-like isoform X1 n=1 Tax=Osmia bicornis bicornis TaxID=1437191 RepID=UPI0010F9683B|nr:purine nucleoside phosphorylase-like isoform X1 [Osmia bicornis bicornis]XP_029037725.1 purine nucleoside phosphorylase-like isoform X1 [Osmia bicornis bicornis]